MKKLSDSSVICFGDIKQAALYFDRVIPGAINKLGANEKGEFGLLEPDAVPMEAFSDLLYGSNKFSDYIKEFGDYVYLWQNTVLKGLPLFHNSEISEKIQELYINNASSPSGNTNVRSIFAKLSDSIGVRSPSILFSRDFTALSDAIDSDLTLSLANLSLIDTDKLSWEEILEIRRDPTLTAKLRNLRLFLSKSYDGKSRGFIEDDLSKRLEEYNDLCKNHRLETRLSVLSMLVDAKNIHAAIGGGIVGTLFGGPIAGLATGASIEIATIAIEIAKKKHAFNKIRGQHELGYLIDVESKAYKNQHKCPNNGN